MTLSKDDDRRRFFRITDAIGVLYEVIDESRQQQLSFDVNLDRQTINLKLLMEQHNNAINTAVEQLQIDQPQAAMAIAELNKKIDTLIKFSEFDHLHNQVGFQQLEQASISACGIAFPVDEVIEADALLRLSLFLQTADEEVQAKGKVIECQKAEGGGFYLRVEFTEMSEPDRESLIQYIVQRQGNLLKSLREQMDGIGRSL